MVLLSSTSGISQSSLLLRIMKRWLRIVLFIIALLVAYCAIRKAYVLRNTYTPSADQVDALGMLGKEAIRSGDVPVAALLLYSDSIIGRGCNTVLRDGNAGGHAEVNALSDAFRSLGRDRFDRLDRERMVLLTTFEPCAMCKGLILEYRIGHVAFIEPRSVWHWIKEDLRSITYELTRQRSGPESLQDSLFRLHPAYDPARSDH